MEYLTDDLWENILARLPLKSITTSKLISKQCKSVVESPFFRVRFLSHKENSRSSTSWSLMCEYSSRDRVTELFAYYRCDTWGLELSLGSYISSFVANKFMKHKDKYLEARVVACADVGLILIRVYSFVGNLSFYVANPVSRECVETPCVESAPSKCFLVTRTENGVLSGFKVVLHYYRGRNTWKTSLNVLIYSSETGLWSPETVQFPFYPFSRDEYYNSISLNGSLHWIIRGSLNNYESFVSVDFYTTGSNPDRCRVTPFPDLGKICTHRRACTTSQGFLTYMSIFYETKDDGSQELKLSVWRLKSWEWELVSQISHNNGFDLNQLAIHPFDAKTVFFWSRVHRCMVSINLRNGDIVRHDELKRSRDGRIMSRAESARLMKDVIEQNFAAFVLPQWLHRIPTTVRRV